MRFVYSGYQNGIATSGTIESGDEASAKKMLRAKSIEIVSLKETKLQNKSGVSLKKRVKPKELALFCKQFSNILKVGVTQDKALAMIGAQTQNKTLKEAIGRLRKKIEQGYKLSEAMMDDAHIFTPAFAKLIAAGEESSSCELCAKRMGEQFEKSSKISASVRKAVSYPIVIFVVVLTVLIVMSVVVIPKFGEMFADMGTDLPPATQLAMDISEILKGHWVAIVLSLIGTVIILVIFGKTNTGAHAFAKLSIKIPVMGPIVQKVYAARFCRTMSTLVSSGMSIDKALGLTAESLSNVLFKEAVIDAQKKVQQGEPIDSAIAKFSGFPLMVSQMLAIGAETGSISEMLEKVAEYFEEETDQATGMLSEMLQPVIIIVVGGMVAFLVLAMYQPMISMYQTMQ